MKMVTESEQLAAFWTSGYRGGISYKGKSKGKVHPRTGHESS